MPGARCDPVLVRQVFANLISNGLKYNLSAHKRVEVGCRADAMPPAYFVRDNGIGIAPRHHAAVFQMFRRLHPRDRFGGGTGSGLAIVKKIIQRHGGTIWIESELGQGATVCFTLEPPSSADSTQVEYPSVVVTQAGRVPPSPAADPAPPPAI